MTRDLPQWLIGAGTLVLAAGVGCGGAAPARSGQSTDPARGEVSGRLSSAQALEGGMGVVSLAALAAGRPEPGGGARNPFRFGRPVAPLAQVGVSGGTPATSGTGAVRAAPGAVRSEVSPEAPMPLKLIGMLDGNRVGRVAVLSDGEFVYHGRTGEIIEGRYRIIRIGVESIELETVDGSGRQTIRLTGS